jgi:predicted glutamine amidotransferase
MCRLLGYVTATPATLADLLGEDELHEFTELSCKHGDGWGAAWAAGSGVTVVKAPDAARMSDPFYQHVRGQAADLGLVHLRWATLGLEVAPDNTHPFTNGSIAFAHNGSIQPWAELDAMIPADLSRLLIGDTDSERYFMAVLAAARSAAAKTGAIAPTAFPSASALSVADMAEGLAATVARIAATCEFTCLNAIVVTPDALIAVCRYNQEVADGEEAPDYYELGYRVAADSVVVSSSGWGGGWTPLGNGEVLVVQRDTLQVSLATVPAAVGGQ